MRQKKREAMICPPYGAIISVGTNCEKCGHDTNGLALNRGIGALPRAECKTLAVKCLPKIFLSSWEKTVLTDSCGSETLV